MSSVALSLVEWDLYQSVYLNPFPLFLVDTRPGMGYVLSITSFPGPYLLHLFHLKTRLQPELGAPL